MHNLDYKIFRHFAANLIHIIQYDRYRKSICGREWWILRSRRSSSGGL